MLNYCLTVEQHDALREAHHFCSLLAQNAKPEFKNKEISDKFNLGNVVQNNWSIFLQNIQIMKEKETVRSIPDFLT